MQHLRERRRGDRDQVSLKGERFDGLAHLGTLEPGIARVRGGKVEEIVVDLEDDALALRLAELEDLENLVRAEALKDHDVGPFDIRHQALPREIRRREHGGAVREEALALGLL
ncbi:hypothetical protein D3C86_1656940 [compost metagenome]